MRKMRTVIATVVCVLGVSVFATGCGQVRGNCEACGRNKPLYELKMEASLLGFSDSATHHVCKECADETIEELKSQAGGFGVTTNYTCEKLMK